MKSNLAHAAPAAHLKPAGEVRVLVILGAIAALYFARQVLVPFAFALTLTFLFTPIVALLQKLRTGRTFAVLVTVVIALAVAGGIGWTILSQLVDVVNQLPLYRENIHAKIEAFHIPATGQLGHAAQSVKEIVQEVASSSPGSSTAPAQSRNPRRPEAQPAPKSPLPVQMVAPAGSEWMELRDLAAPALGVMARSGIVAIFTVFMLLKREDLRNRLLRLVGIGQLNMMTQALDDAADRVSSYMLMQFLVNAGFGFLFGLGLYLIGVPYPVLWGVVAAILRIVPYVGTVAAALLPIALSLAVFDGWLKPFLVFMLAGTLELIVANFIEPWLYGARVGISSLALLVTAVLWTVLWGPAGLILSTPLTVCVVVLGRYVPQLSFLHILLGDEPVLATEAQIYQRLLAMDQAEAQTIVDQFVKGKPVVELYDAVLIPALTMAEQDRHKGAIDATREEFLFLSINEIIAELSEHQPPAPSPEPSPEKKITACRGRILCLAAHDRADEVTGSMLAQLLEQRGLAVISFPLGGAAPHEWIQLLDVTEHDVVCVSALPPYAFAPARLLCKQIREQFPKVKIIVCVWGFSGDRQRAMSRFERTPPDRLATSLAAAITDIEELARPSS